MCPVPATYAAPIISYSSPLGTGNQSWTGPLGTDFDVNAPIRILALGAFDSDQNGIQSEGITVSISNRNDTTSPQVTASISGNGDFLDGGDRFVNIKSFTLGIGQYSVVAWGYGALNPNGNSYGGSDYPSLNTGGGLISFVGSSRYDLAGTFPMTLDAATARYGAGTFQFEAAAVPEPTSLVLMGSGLLALGLRMRRRKA